MPSSKNMTQMVSYGVAIVLVVSHGMNRQMVPFVVLFNSRTGSGQDVLKNSDRYPNPLDCLFPEPFDIMVNFDNGKEDSLLSVKMIEKLVEVQAYGISDARADVRLWVVVCIVKWME